MIEGLADEPFCKLLEREIVIQPGYSNIFKTSSCPFREHPSHDQALGTVLRF